MTYELAIAIVRWLLHRFFRRVEVTGLEHLPAEGGGLVVSWHPNGLIDPALILTHLPRRVVFGARDGLFKWPLLGTLMRALGTVPIYRAQDRHAGSDEERRLKNRASLDALAAAVAKGSFSALFPEGVSHDDSSLHELKVGAARLYYRAGQLRDADAPPPVIVPVGLHYDQKAVFRSKALVAFHPPITLTPELASLPEDTPDEVYRARCTALTAEIGRALEASVHPTESWEIHQLMERTRRLVRAERAARAHVNPGAPAMSEVRTGFARVWEGYRTRRESDPAATEALMKRVREYGADLAGLGLEDHQLDSAPRSAKAGWTALLVLEVFVLYTLLPPLLVLGLAINGPPYLFLKWISGKTAKLEKDKATIKWLGAVLLFPLVWGSIGALVYLGSLNLHASFPSIPSSPLQAAVVTLLLGALGGLVSLRYTEKTGATLRAMRVRLTRRRFRDSVTRLRQERAEITCAIEALSQGLDLPGALDGTGRIVPRAPLA